MLISLGKKYAMAKDALARRSIKPSEVIRTVIYLICCAVMFYQVTCSILDYYQYKTVVQIRISNNDKQDMPAVSICKQMKATEYLELLKNGDPEFAAKFANRAMSTTPEAKTDLNSTEEKEEEKQWDALANISHYFDMDGRNAESLFGIIGQSLKVSCYDVRTGTAKDCEISAYPINSFSQRRICITFFSQLYINYNFSESNFNISDNDTDKEEHKENLFAYFAIENPTNDVFAYIHTSKSMPDINLYDLEMTRSRLFNKTTYGIIYTKFTVRRMEYPYSTDCMNYVKKRVSVFDPLSEFGCIIACKKRFWRHILDPCVPMDLNYIMGTEDQYYKICPCTVRPCDKTIQLGHCEKCTLAETDEYKKWSADCETNCREDCYEEYYQKDIFELKDDFRDVIWQKYEIKPEMVTDQHTLIFLAAKYQEEISYTHTPKMSEFDFFAALGGLFSLWIGASVLTIYDAALVVLKCAFLIKSNIDKGKNLIGTKFKKHVKIMREDPRRHNLYDDMTRLRRTPTDFGKVY